tara:strand:- start:1140 stop:1610 length:471 start_codon:yes stop_codon:yes gene_type:complete
LGGRRGRLISPPDRQHAIELINEAVSAGAPKEKACQALELTIRTVQRWTEGDELKVDCRPTAARPEPANKLSDAERQALLDLSNQAEYASLPPGQIVPRLADKGIYVASESTFYRVLSANNQLHHRGRSRAPRKVARPTTYTASGPNQVWSWDSVP